MDTNWTYYHNPKCSKSREGLQLLNTKNVKFRIKLYLKETITQDELTHIQHTLIDPVSNLTRSKNSEDPIQTILADPSQLQRPILVGKTKSKIGRPPESLLDILD